MNKSEIAERAGRIEKILFRRALENKLVGYTLETSLEIERAIAESRGQAETLKSLIAKITPENIHAGDGEPSSAPPDKLERVRNSQPLDSFIGAVPSLGVNLNEESELTPEQAATEILNFVERCNSGYVLPACEKCKLATVAIIERAWRSGAAQEVSPPSPRMELCANNCTLPEGHTGECDGVAAPLEPLTIDLLDGTVNKLKARILELGKEITALELRRKEDAAWINKISQDEAKSFASRCLAIMAYSAGMLLRGEITALREKP